ncbi:hypothetical protein BT69DRAFT_1280777 [Atractiella rhizophila]|nr:hypothetical protein BT69DRAFT_1280777 [Atractiella rhizophila]
MMPEEDAHEAVSFPTASALSAYSSEFHPKSSLASSIGAVGSASAHEPPFALPGFYEHRLQHYRDRKNSANRSSSSMENVHGAIGSGSNFSSKRNSLIQEESAPFGSFGLGSTCHAPPISLPFQFMNNGLLPTDAVTSTPESEAPTAVPASPVTPHQAALLPSQLFDLLEQQEDAPPSNLGSWPHYGLSDEDGEEIGYRSVGELGGMALPRRDDGLVFEPISPTPRTTNLPAAAYGPYFTGYDTQRAAPPRRPAALNPDAKSFSPQTKTRGSRSSTLSIELPNASAAMPGITGQHYSPFTPASSMTAPKVPTSLWNDVWSSASTRVENSPLSAPAMEKDATLTGGIVDKEFEDDYDPLLVPYTR